MAIRAYHDDPELKAACLADVDWHLEHDSLVKGRYWKDGKGCFVGCLTHNAAGGHEQLAEKYGWPEWLCRLCDTLHEGLAYDRTAHFFKAIPSAIPVGFSDWDELEKKIKVYILSRNIERLEALPDLNKEVFLSVVDATKKIIGLLESESVTEKDWSAANSAAKIAANSAAKIAANSAARAACSAWSAVWSAESALEIEAARVSWKAAWSAAWSASESASWGALASATSSAEFEAIASELVRLLSGGLAMKEEVQNNG